MPRAAALAFVVSTVLPLAGCAASTGDVPGGSSPEPGPPPAAAAPPSLVSGAYTEDQAARGAEVFGSLCGECHDTIEFRGADFFFNWEGSTVGRFVQVVSETMPEDDPGGLSREQYLDVAAYVLRLNDYPAGATPLPDEPEALAALVFERPGAAPSPAARR